MRTRFLRIVCFVAAAVASGCSLVVGSYEVGDAGGPIGTNPGGSCGLLSTCCATQSALDELSCNATVSAGVAGACEASLGTYCSTSMIVGFDAGSGSGSPDSMTTCGGGDCFTDAGSSVCSQLSECCPTLPASSVADCDGIAAADDSMQCATAYSAAVSAGYCVPSVADAGFPEDAPSEFDAGGEDATPPPFDATTSGGEIPCAGATCSLAAGEQCCEASSTSGECQPAGSSCSGSVITCEETSDCSPGQICCLAATGLSSATVSCQYPQSTPSGCPTTSSIANAQVCQSSSECPSGSCSFYSCAGTVIESCTTPSTEFCTAM